jgi:hypothetical protein
MGRWSRALLDLIGADDRLGSGSHVWLRLLSGEAGMRVIDVSQIDGNIRKVIDR